MLDFTCSLLGEPFMQTDGDKIEIVIGNKDGHTEGQSSGIHESTTRRIGRAGSETD